MSCNTFIPIMDLVREVEALLAANYIDKDDPRITNGVFTNPTIREGFLLDVAAREEFCRLVQECGLDAPFGKMWMPRPLSPTNTLVSYEDIDGEILTKWIPANKAPDGKMWLPKPVSAGALPTSYIDVDGELKVKWETVSEVLQNSGALQVTDSKVDIPAKGSMIAQDQAQKNKRMLTVEDFGPSNDGTYHPLSERFDSLALARAVYPTAKTLDDSIDTVALESFFDYCRANRVAFASLAADLYISRPIDVEGMHSTIYTGNLVLSNTQEVTELPYLMSINARGFFHRGRMEFRGNRTSKIQDRKQLTGLRVGDGGTDGSAARVNIDALNFIGFRDAGLDLINDSIFFTCGYVFSERIGASNNTVETDIGHIGTIESRSDVIANDFSQRSNLRVSSMPPNTFGTRSGGPGVYIIHAGEVYQVKSADYGSNTISVYPNLNYASQVTDFRYIYGAGVSYTGNNSGCATIQTIQSILCGIGFVPDSLYGGSVGELVTEFCGIGMLMGLRSNSLVIGYTIDNAYFEGNVFNLVLGGHSAEYSGIKINNSHAMLWEKCADVYNYRVKGYDAQGLGGWRFETAYPSFGITQDGVTYETEDNRNFASGNLTIGGKLRYIPRTTTALTVDWPKAARLSIKNIILVVAPGAQMTFTSTTPLTGNVTIPASDTHTIVHAYLELYPRGVALKADAIAPPPIARSGSTLERPALPPTGFQYYDTSLGKPVFFNSAQVWVDATGAES